MSFLDSTITPHRVLKLFEFLRSRSDKSFETRDLKRAFQPTALENVTDQSDQIGDAVRACIGLGLAARDTARTVKSVDASPEKSSKNTREPLENTRERSGSTSRKKGESPKQHCSPASKNLPGRLFHGPGIA